MTGDIADLVSRIKLVLPRRWFADQSPNLDAVIASIATPWVWLYGLIDYVIDQSRIATATDQWLDLIAGDYFGLQNGRKADESDCVYRARIQAALLREAATRSAVTTGLTELLGVQPSLFEPANCIDTGAYGVGAAVSGTTTCGMAYGRVGGWGSLQLPFQFFVTATRPPTPGVGMLAGYGTSNGSYGGGSISYIDLALLPGQVTDADIQATLGSLLPINTIAWLRII